MIVRGSSFPVWLTLGFASGLVFAWLFLHAPSTALVDAKVPAPRDARPASPPVASLIPDARRDVNRLSEVEALFRAWGGYCIWKNNVTQFALWNSETDSHSDFYEVRRSNRIYYFRTLPGADWPLVDHGEMVRCPLWFAETPEMREKFYQEHPEAAPGSPILRSMPQRAPLLPPLSPAAAESDQAIPAGSPPVAVPPAPILTPGAGR